MLATGLHWMSALAIAVGVHALGLLWFDPGQSTLPRPNVFSDEIVVMLGRGSGSSLESARLLQTPVSVAKLEVSAPAQTEPLAGSAEKSVAPSQVRPNVALAAVEPSPAPDAKAVEHKPESQDVAVAEIGEADPDISTSEAEAAETVSTVSVTAQAGAAYVPPATVVVALADAAVQSTPATVDIESPDAEVSIVVSPTQLVRETADLDAPDVIAVEESPYGGAAETASTDRRVEKVEAKLPDDVIAPAQSPSPDTVRVDSAAAPQPDVFESEQPVAAEVEQDIQQSTLAAVVLEFETVEATTVAPSRAPAPQVAQPVSIEQQIARALSVEELQGQNSVKGIVARYAGQLKGRLEESMHYPRAARLAGQEGRVVVRFVIDRNGRVLSIVLEKSSGYAILDREAVEMIERGEPYPTMPSEMGDEVLELRVPIAYKIKEGTRNKDIPPIYLE